MDHAPPCPVPWSNALFGRSPSGEDDNDAEDACPEPLEQAPFEGC